MKTYTLKPEVNSYYFSPSEDFDLESAVTAFLQDTPEVLNMEPFELVVSMDVIPAIKHPLNTVGDVSFEPYNGPHYTAEYEWTVRSFNTVNTSAAFREPWLETTIILDVKVTKKTRLFFREYRTCLGFLRIAKHHTLGGYPYISQWAKAYVVDPPDTHNEDECLMFDLAHSKGEDLEEAIKYAFTLAEWAEQKQYKELHEREEKEAHR